MLTIKCPDCRRAIGTTHGVGQVIPCPYCGEEFEIERDMVVRSSALGNSVAKFLIPLGYVLFVAVPMGFTIWFLVNRAENQERAAKEEEARAARAAVVLAELPPEPKKPAPKKVRPKPPDGGPNPGPEWEPEPEPKPEFKPEPNPRPVVVPPVVVPPVPAVVALAPAPREVAEVHVAPEPHPAPWRVALIDPDDKWQTAGVSDARMAGYTVTKVPLVDGKGRTSESAELLVVVIEVRMNTATKKRELQSWRVGQVQSGTMFAAAGRELPYIEFPLGTRIDSGLPLKQPIPSDGTPVRDILLFAVPPAGSGELSLRLPCERFGGFGDLWFKIPADSWKKK